MCERMFTAPCLLEFVSVCWRWVVFVSVCWCLLVFVIICCIHVCTSWQPAAALESWPRAAVSSPGEPLAGLSSWAQSTWQRSSIINNSIAVIIVVIIDTVNLGNTLPYHHYHKWHRQHTKQTWKNPRSFCKNIKKNL